MTNDNTRTIDFEAEYLQLMNEPTCETNYNPVEKILTNKQTAGGAADYENVPKSDKREPSTTIYYASTHQVLELVNITMNTFAVSPHANNKTKISRENAVVETSSNINDNWYIGNEGNTEHCD